MKKLIGALFATASFCFGAAHAQTATDTAATSIEQNGAIEKVVVTARRREEDVQKIPVNVKAISGEELRVGGVNSALDLQNVAPTLTVAGNLGSRDDDVFTIRGQSQPFGGADPGVQTYFAEVPFNASGPGSTYDMDNIQVLSGPQGTLFGRNTTGGAILFQPKKPGDDFGGYVDAQMGNYSMMEAQGAVNFPVIADKLLVRVAGDIAERDGFTRDLTFGTDLDNVNYKAFRAGVTIRPFTGFENYVVFDYLQDHNHGTGAELTGVDTATLDNLATEFLGAPCTVPPTSAQCGALEAFEGAMQGALAQQQALGPRKTTSSIPLFFRRDSWGATDIASYDLATHLRVRNIFGYRSDKEQPAFDYDGSQLPILDIANSRTWESNSLQVTDEFQLVGETDDNSVQWVAGFYHELDHPGGYSEVERLTFGGAQPIFSPFFGFGNTEIDSLQNGGDSNAVYANGVYDASNILSGLSFTLGGRYTWDHKLARSRTCIIIDAADSCPFPLTPLPVLVQNANFHAPSWTLAANYQVTDDSMVYATYRRGYKSGGFNSGAGLATDFAGFRPEYLTDLELGTKNNWTILGVPGRTNFDAYYGWYQNVQKNDLIQVLEYSPAAPPPLNPPIAGSFNALTFNAARAHIRGLDFSSTLVPDENFEVSVFYSYTDARYDRFSLPQQIIVIDPPANVQMAENPLDHSGNPFAYTPRNKFGVTGQFHIPIDQALGSPAISASWYEQSKVWFSDLSDVEPDAFQKSYDLVNLRLDWNNFLGSPFDASVFVNNATDQTYKVGANALLHLTGTSASIYGPPRMWGIELRARFGEDAKD